MRALCNSGTAAAGGGRGRGGSGGGGPSLRHVIAIDTSLSALREAKDWGYRFARFIALNGARNGGAGETEEGRGPTGGAWSHVNGGGELEIVYGSVLRPPPAILISNPSSSSSSSSAPARDSPSEHEHEHEREREHSPTAAASAAAAAAGGGVDVAVLMEVIEHLPKSHLDVVTARVLGRAPGCIRPRMCIVTTPNADYNKNIDKALAAAAAGGEVPNEGGDYGGGGGNGGAPPRLRHPDHKYELTAREFKAWARDAETRYGYYVEVEYIGRVGGGGRRRGGEIIHADVMDVEGDEDDEGVDDGRRVNVYKVG